MQNTYISDKLSCVTQISRSLGVVGIIMNKNVQSTKSQHEDAIYNRIIFWFAAATVLESLLLVLKRFYLNYKAGEIELMAGIHLALHVLTYAGIALCAAGVVWALLSRKDGKIRLLPKMVAGFSFAVSVCAFITRHFQAAGMMVLLICVPVCAVLALVYNLYQREFFWITVLGGLTIFGLWLYRRAIGTHSTIFYGYLAVLALVLVLSALLGRKLQTTDGVLTAGGKKLHLFSHNTSYATLYATCALSALTVVSALVLGSTVAYYSIFVVVVWIFVMAVYYTVRLM
ncbi:hypothetical protein SDC9_72496 [bioreactor metagenome]|uniref:Uncharacterized protein n=1 Tax=bioreactor metagenome TaxID=1076179 RepID=A0A644YBS6_9ZZZZ